jgi:hypothetical protein
MIASSRRELHTAREREEEKLRHALALAEAV